MKIKELINELKKFHEDALVVLPGADGGFNTVGEIRDICLKNNTNVGTAYNFYDYEENLGQSNAILLRGKSRQKV